ncbi:hypothetical protein ACQP1P_13195 [Dactylosporangium sp. CA-052675]|uniref:hypothetical protein n=1 Tax=Dactylosporangium sp. CA-052675 TaxID=3239927 RepID=UPI003D910654
MASPWHNIIILDNDNQRPPCAELLDESRRRLADAAPAGTDWPRACVATVRGQLFAEAERLGLPARDLAATLLCAVLAPHWRLTSATGALRQAEADAAAATGRPPA